MKKLMIALSLAALVSGVANASDEDITIDAAPPAVNYDLKPVTEGTITFNGSVVSKTCTLSEANKQVKLPEVSHDQLLNGPAGKTVFDIKLDNCAIPQDKFVTLQFNPTKDSVTSDGLLLNTAKGEYVSNVLLQLNDSNNKKIDLQPVNAEVPNIVGEINGVKDISLKSLGEVAYSFSIEYVKNSSEQIIPGKVEATLPFTISYK